MIGTLYMLMFCKSLFTKVINLLSRLFSKPQQSAVSNPEDVSTNSSDEVRLLYIRKVVLLYIRKVLSIWLCQTLHDFLGCSIPLFSSRSLWNALTVPQECQSRNDSSLSRISVVYFDFYQLRDIFFYFHYIRSAMEELNRQNAT